jgi:hypothetical protein
MSITTNTTIYYAEKKCECKTKKDNKPCINLAYYLYNGKYCCGVHSKKENRSELPKNPKRKEIIKQNIEMHFNTCKEFAKINKQNNKKGDVICCKLYMMKPVELVKGYINIFPNFKHANRIDGIGLPSLSPKSIGPINHGQPNLPISLNLENFHQGNKVFTNEVSEHGEPTQEFFDTQISMYKDAVPHRHKKNATGNAPVFSIWIDKQDEQHKISYFESRQFYCQYYEKFVSKHSDFVKLQKKIKNGYNLRIVGYDGYNIINTLEEHYCDVSKSFGHEMVLYTMLTCNVSEYPWKKYKTFDF